MERKFSLQYVDISPDVPKGKFIFKTKSLESLVFLCPPMFVADTKIIYGYNFVVPLSLSSLCRSYYH